MKNRMSNASQQFVDFFSQVACWTWETLEKLLDIILDFLARIIELILAVMNLIFQVICFLRDLCIEAMQTFANVFRGIVNVVRNISCEEVEDFASACIVILLWIVAFKLVRNLFQVGILRIRKFLFNSSRSTEAKSFVNPLPHSSQLEEFSSFTKYRILFCFSFEKYQCNLQYQTKIH